MPGHARLDAPGTLPHVIVWHVERGQISDDRKNWLNFVSWMGKLASESGTVIYAWALMKNHAHILLCNGLDGLSKYMRRFVTGYAITYIRLHNLCGILFQNAKNHFQNRFEL